MLWWCLKKAVDFHTWLMNIFMGVCNQCLYSNVDGPLIVMVWNCPVSFICDLSEMSIAHVTYFCHNHASKHMALVNWAIIGFVRCQVITWTNDDLWSVGPLGLYEFWIISLTINGYGNVICKMAAILFKPQWSYDVSGAVIIMALINGSVWFIIEVIENNVCTRMANCLCAHERVIFVFISRVAQQRGK